MKKNDICVDLQPKPHKSVSGFNKRRLMGLIRENNIILIANLDRGFNLGFCAISTIGIRTGHVGFVRIGIGNDHREWVLLISAHSAHFGPFPCLVGNLDTKMLISLVIEFP